MSFNKEQTEAISHGQGPCMVLAPPGSGKTLVVTQRTKYLIEKLNIPAEQILVITFTRYAAREMRERFEMLTKGKAYPVTFGTFHSVFYSILKCEYGINASNLMAEKDSLALVKHILDQMYIESEITVEDDDELVADLSQDIGIVKNGLYHLNDFKSKHLNKQEFAELFRAYEEEKRKMHKLDFDDMLVQCYALLKKFPDKLAKWQKRFLYILVDEFQDINRVQYEVLRMLAGKDRNLFVVGDDDQSIYGFRGAHPELMMGLRRDFPEIKIISLGVNYRSTEYIVGAASKVILHNDERYKKKIQAFRGKGKNVHVQEVKDELEESKYVAGEIEKDLRSGIKPYEICVLYRAGIQARMLTEILKDHHIEFQMKEHINNFYQHFIVKDMLAYMKLAMGKRERYLFLMICNHPLRYLSRNCMEKNIISFEDLRKFYCDKEWMQDIIDQFEVDVRMMEHMAPYAAVQYIRKGIGYDEFLKKYSEEHQIPLEQLQEVIKRFEERCKEYRTYQDLLNHIESYTRELDNQEKSHKFGNKTDQNKIQLMTMHASKGLEFESVYIIHANEGEIPYQKARTQKEMEEERRMFYVAMTRAKDKLNISYILEKSGKRVCPSRFVNEILGQVSK